MKTLHTLILGLAILALISPSALIQAQNVGIGIDSPTEKLDIRGVNTDDGATIQTANSDASHFLKFFPGRLNDPNPFIMWKNGDPLRFASDAGGWTEYMRIHTNGNVGIGISAPLQKLHVAGTGRFSSLSGSGSTLVRANNDGDIENIDNGSDGQIMVINSGAPTWSDAAVLDDKDWFQIGTTNPATGIGDWIYTMGNIGINYGDDVGENPYAALHVKTNAYIGDENTGTFFNSNAILHLARSNNPHLLMEDISDNTGGLSLDGGGLNVVTENSDIDFRTGVTGSGDYSGTGNSRMIIKNGGNIGINTISPDRKLEIKSHVNDGNTEELVRVTNTAGQATGRVAIGLGNDTRPSGKETIARISAETGSGHNNSALYFDVGDASQNLQTRMKINKDGNVGIGTTSPAQKLHVAGNARITDLGGFGNAVVFTDDDGDLFITDLTSADDVLLGSGVFGPSPGEDIDWYEASTITSPDAITDNIYTQGLVGVGDFSGSNPGTQVHIKGSGELLRLENPGGAGGFLGIHDNGGRIAYIGDGGSGSDHLNIGADPAGGSGRIHFNFGDASNAEQMVLHENGNVGIGTASPGSLLHVTSGTDEDAEIKIEADTDNNDEADNPILTLSQDGGTVTGYLGMEGTAGTKSTGTLADALILGSETANPAVQLVTNDITRMTIEPGGNIGMGYPNSAPYNNPDRPLEVGVYTPADGTVEAIRVVTTRGHANSRPAIAFGNTTRPTESTMARISAETGAGHAAANMIVEVGDQNKVLQERMVINQRGEIFGKFRETTRHRFQCGDNTPNGNLDNNSRLALWLPKEDYKDGMGLASKDNNHGTGTFAGSWIVPYDGRIAKVIIKSYTGNNSGSDLRGGYFAFKNAHNDNLAGDAGTTASVLGSGTGTWSVVYAPNANTNVSTNLTGNEAFNLDPNGCIKWVNDDFSDNATFSEGQFVGFVVWADFIYEGADFEVLIVWEYDKWD